VAQRALYLDLRKIVETKEDSGWVVDSVRQLESLEPTLHSLCQVEPYTRRALDAWIDRGLQLAGGSAENSYRAHGHSLEAASHALTLERTLGLLRYGEAHAHECPFWLEPRAKFDGQQYDGAHWVVLAESTGFASLVLKSWIPALGGGGRLLLGHGIAAQLTLAVGGELAASGTFVPQDGQGFDATAALAAPILLRYTRLSRMLDIELAPVVRFAARHKSWPPGARIELGVGISGLRGAAFMGYNMLYLGYEVHPRIAHIAMDHTIQLGTRLALDWSPR
jgi:hypothetical protein